MNLVSVIIINYNTFELTCNCIESVYKHSTGIQFEIIVVDNASTECTPQLIKKRFHSIKLIQSASNIGFAGGNNLGIEHATGSYILLLNSDTLLTENSIKITYEKFKHLKNPGFVGIKTFYPNGDLQYTCGRLPTLKNIIFRFFFITRIFKLYKKYSKLDETFSPEFIWGCYLFFEKKLLTHFSGNKLNDLFFMYHEDLLWCWEARQAGFKNYFIAETSFIHLFRGSQSHSVIRTKMNQHFSDNQYKLEKIINGKWGYYIYNFFKKQMIIREKVKPNI